MVLLYDYLKRRLRTLLNKEYRKSKIVSEVNSIMAHRNDPNHALVAASMNDKLSDYIGRMTELAEQIESMVEGNVVRAAEHNLYQKIHEIQDFIKRLNDWEFGFDARLVFDRAQRIEKLIRSKLTVYLEREQGLYANKNIHNHFSSNVDFELASSLNLVKILKKDKKAEEKELDLTDQIMRNIHKSIDGPPVVEEEKDIYRLFYAYKKDIVELFEALFTAQEEESALLKQLDYFIMLCDTAKLDFHNKRTGQQDKLFYTRLVDLRKRIKRHISTDILNAGTIQSFEGSLTDVLSKAKKILVSYFSINNLQGASYKIKDTGRGILLLGGVTTSFRQYESIIYRLAYAGYAVFTVDLPYHGLSFRSKLRIPFISRCVYDAVRYIRATGVSQVGVIGQSLGAIGCIHSLLGYDEQMEDFLIDEWSKLMKHMRRVLSKERLIFSLDRKLKSGEGLGKDDEEFLLEIKRLNDFYNEFKGQLLGALQRTRFGGKLRNTSSMIDAMVLMSPPYSIQGGNMIPGFLRRMPRLSEVFFQFMANLPTYYNLYFDIRGGRKKDLVPYDRPPILGRKEVELVFLRIPRSDFVDFMKYLAKTPNPWEILSMIDFFTKLPNPDGKARFFSYIKNTFIKRVPKLLMYGSKDELMQPGKNRSIIKEAYELYMDQSTSEIKEYPGLAHHFEAPIIPLFGFDKRGRKARVAYVQDDIVSFFRRWV